MKRQGNTNYRAGRNFEYATRKHWAKRGMTVHRSAGSHGIFDLCAFEDDKPVVGIQCKRVDSLADAKRLMRDFQSAPPLKPSRFYRQVLEVKVKGSRDPIRIEV